MEPDNNSKKPTTRYALTGGQLRQRSNEKEFDSSENACRAESNDAEESESPFQCNICLDTASSPVVTLCGHLYCWPCIYRWMTSDRSAAATCPVCKSGISKDQCVPIFCRGREATDPREKEIPERPKAQRSEPPRRSNVSTGGAFNISGFTFSAGVGLPGFFGGVQWGFDGPEPAVIDLGSQQQLIARVFFMMGILALFTIIFF